MHQSPLKATQAIRQTARLRSSATAGKAPNARVHRAAERHCESSREGRGGGSGATLCWATIASIALTHRACLSRLRSSTSRRFSARSSLHLYPAPPTPPARFRLLVFASLDPLPSGRRHPNPLPSLRGTAGGCGKGRDHQDRVASDAVASHECAPFRSSATAREAPNARHQRARERH